MNVIHFNSTQERLRFLRGEFKEIQPKIASQTGENGSDEELTKNEQKNGSVAAKDPSDGKPKKGGRRKTKSDEVKTDEIQTE